MNIEDVQKANVPKYEELCLEVIYVKALDKFPEMEDYFPNYSDKYLPPRDFFWTIFSTLHTNTVRKIIKRSQEKRIVNEENHEEELIRVRDDILEMLEKTAYESSKHLLTARKEKWLSYSLTQE